MATTPDVPTRDELRELFRRDYELVAPDADTSQGTQPYIDASTHADTSVALWAYVLKTSQRLDLENIAGTDLEDEAERQGQRRRLPGAGGAGFGTVEASSLGGDIFAGDECKTDPGGVRFYCTDTRHYNDGDPVPLAGRDIGPQTNQLAGTTLKWTNQRPGIGAKLTVFKQADGSGLSGGRDQESDPEIRKRIRDVRQNPPASGNDAQVQKLVSETPGLGIERVFTYPCIKGAGTTGYVSLMRPAYPGGSRIANSTQIAQTLANITGQLPIDYGFLASLVIPVSVDVALQINWAGPGWTNARPWPYFAPTTPVQVTKIPAPTATAFRLDCSGTPIAAGVTSQPAPIPGAVIAFYDANANDPATGPVFRRKTILTATSAGGGLYDIVCDTTNAQTDDTYTPLVHQTCGPWSESLNLLPAPATDHFELLGPGEQLVSFFDDGNRERRNPRNPDKYPSDLTHRILSEYFDLSVLSDVSILAPAIPFACPVGVAGVSSNLLVLRFLTAYAA